MIYKILVNAVTNVIEEWGKVNFLLVFDFPVSETFEIKIKDISVKV